MREGAIKIRIDRATKDALGAIAKSRGEGISMVVREAIRIYLAEKQLFTKTSIQQ